jgi:hypothetical protein
MKQCKLDPLKDQGYAEEEKVIACDSTGFDLSPYFRLIASGIGFNWLIAWMVGAQTSKARG